MLNNCKRHAIIKLDDDVLVNEIMCFGCPEFDCRYYCAYGEEPSERECYCCNMSHYGMDCRNNLICDNEEEE
ncbi:MAG: hypothetical protein E7600_09350 [Ruminococcaceae bacterium]|nr:hypothetical protein [Oscillospiraceae bacterium]